MSDPRFAGMLECGVTIRPPSGWLANVAIARSVSSPPLTSTPVTWTSSDGAPASAARNIATVATESEPKSTAARRMLGAASLSTPSHFPPHGWLEVLETADICARSRQTGDKTAVDWVGDLG